MAKVEAFLLKAYSAIFESERFEKNLLIGVVFLAGLLVASCFVKGVAELFR